MGVCNLNRSMNLGVSIHRLIFRVLSSHETYQPFKLDYILIALAGYLQMQAGPQHTSFSASLD